LPSPSKKVELEILEKVIVKDSSSSSRESANTVKGIFPEVLPAEIVRSAGRSVI